jgi:hypothetical protein
MRGLFEILRRDPFLKQKRYSNFGKQKEYVMINPTEKLSSIRTKLDLVEREIEFLEAYLTSTSGPAKDTIAELNMLKDVQNFYRIQYNNAYKEYEESKKNDSC